MTDPGFEAGGRAAQFIDAKTIRVPLTSDFKHDVKAMAAASPAAGCSLYAIQYAIRRYPEFREMLQSTSRLSVAGPLPISGGTAQPLLNRKREG